ncbi:hypothetical protein [Pseudarthrobacter sp. NPDC080039]|uniref:LysM peptidoglycan-binding domain-containing protein n=1 Tax=unclassified Pseudarthrobacter TaxID=2647000 RepID=UPI0034501F91
MARSTAGKGPDVAMALALLMLGLVLCTLGAGLLAQWQDSAARHQDTSADVLLAAAAAAAGISILLWWTVSVLGAGAAVVLDHLGRRQAAAAARRFSPAFMQRAVVAALSIQLVTGVAANASATAPGPQWMPTHAQSLPASVTSPPAPVTPSPTVDDNLTAAAVPTPSEPTQEALTSPAAAGPVMKLGGQLSISAVDPGWQPVPPLVEQGLLAGPESRSLPATGTGGKAQFVTVLAGDTLWDIVACFLGPEASEVDIALEWPRWYAANRALIGGSPDVLLPGQVLQAPEGS